MITTRPIDPSDSFREPRRGAPLWIAVGFLALSGCASAVVSLLTLH
jgi:hypothetical protein